MLIFILTGYQDDKVDFGVMFKDIQLDCLDDRPNYELLLAQINSDPLDLATFFITCSTFKGKACLHHDNLYVKVNPCGWIIAIN